MSNGFERLVRELVSNAEAEWLEFKENNADPQQIGNNVSALANSVALQQRTSGFIVWGIRNEDHTIVGTSFNPRKAKINGQEFENWLVTQLEPSVNVKIHDGHIEGRYVAILEVAPATNQPVRFKGTEYIRVGSCSKKLADHPEKERELWAVFSRTSFETGIALEAVTSNDVLTLLNYPEYFRLMRQPLPENRSSILEKLSAEKLIQRRPNDRYDITNLGAILFAQALRRFDRLARKALRVVIYRGVNKVETVREQLGTRGYAVGFEGAIGFINDLLPQNEQIGQALRREVRMYPEIAIRELVANALIHQDFTVTGAGPMVEIFDGRMEISNPGKPLIDTLRFIDEPPRSRNESLAAMMRRMNMCEERGSGIDKVIFHVEAYQLPAPDFRSTDSSTVAVLYGPEPLHKWIEKSEFEPAISMLACYRFRAGE